MKKIIIIISALFVCITTGIGIGVYHYYHQYDNNVYTSKFIITNSHKWWYGQNATELKTAYAQAKSNAVTVSLIKFYTGHTVYFTKDNKPFIISGTAIVYLQQNGSALALSEADKANLRAEYTGQKIQTGSQAEIDTVNNQLKEAETDVKTKQKTTALIVNNQLIKNKIAIQKDKKGNLLFNVHDLLPSIGVNYKIGTDSIHFSFHDSSMVAHTFDVSVARLDFQPWVDKKTKNIFPAISKMKGQYFIAQNILTQCFGFDVTYDKTFNCVKAVTDSADVVTPIVSSNYSIDSSHVIPLDTADKLGVINANGVLKDDAAKIYDISIQPDVESVSLNKTSITLTVGGTASLTPTVSPSNAKDASVTWSSTDKNVASVSDGVITAISGGDCIIKATTANGKAATCNVTVSTTTKHTICIDPGHQILVDLSQEPEAPGSSIMKEENPGGAEGIVTKMPEYKLNLAVSLKMEQKLKALGYGVVMTRETNDVNIGNIARAEVANNCNADLFIRVHADGVDDQSVKGISILVPGSQFVTDASLRTESTKAAQYLMNGMIATTGANNRGLVERNDMTGLNWCTRPMMLVEMGFMSNPDEDVAMSTDAYQDKLATGMVNGINKYFSDKDH